MKYEEWKVPGAPAFVPEELVRAGFTPLAAALLALRQIDSPERARAFLSCGAEALTDPLLLDGMEAAAHRVRRAIDKRESVAVYGDYDVDGITSACLVTRFLRSRGLDALPYIPDRIEEGYGLNRSAMDVIKSRGVSLVITVDCGITARDTAQYAASLGMDLVITDHHECGNVPLPEAVAVVDPRIPGSRFPDCGLAGVGVAFKLLCAVTGDSEGILNEYCDLIATGTVADVMPLVGENRYIVARGLRKLASSPCAGLRALITESGAAQRRLNASTVGFTLAPRINAAGRLGRADVAVRLLLTDSEAEAASLAAELCELNRERQALEQEIWNDAVGRLGSAVPTAPIVLADEGWHQGVIGVAASRIAEAYDLPTCVIYLDGENGKGSCRSVGGFNFFDALCSCSDCLTSFGGHMMAAGLCIRRDRIDAFREALARYYGENPPERGHRLSCDLRVTAPELLSMECVESLDALEPFGTGNPRPVLCLCDMLLDRVTPIGGGKHLRLRFTKGGLAFDGVLFARAERELGASEGDRVDVAFFPQINEYGGRRTVQLLVIDVRQTDLSAPCRAVLRNERLERWDCAEMSPDRGDFIRVWRWLERRGGKVTGAEEDTAAWRPGGMHPAKLLICLRVMSDRGLIRMDCANGEIHIETRQFCGKADLDSHPTVRYLREIRSCYTGRR